MSLSIDSQFEKYPREDYLKLRSYLESVIESTYTQTTNLLTKKFGCTPISSAEELKTHFSDAGSTHTIIRLTVDTDGPNFEEGMTAPARGAKLNIPKEKIRLIFSSSDYSQLIVSSPQIHYNFHYQLTPLPPSKKLFVYVRDEQPSNAKLFVDTRVNIDRSSFEPVYYADFLESKFYLGSPEYTAWQRAVIEKHKQSSADLVRRHIHL